MAVSVLSSENSGGGYLFCSVVGINNQGTTCLSVPGAPQAAPALGPSQAKPVLPCRVVLWLAGTTLHALGARTRQCLPSLSAGLSWLQGTGMTVPGIAGTETEA